MVESVRVLSLVALAFGSAWLPSRAEAQAPPVICGPDCTHPGRYVLCNDSFDAAAQTGGGVQLIEFLDTVCASFSAPAASFDLTGFVVLADGGDMIISLLDVREESRMPLPGSEIFSMGVGIPSAASRQFSGLYFSPVTLDREFRICLRQQVDDPSGQLSIRPIMYDADGIQGQNQTRVLGQGWQDATFGPATGDFVLRAVVEYADLAPWGPGGICTTTFPDGGVGDTGGIDGGNDSGVPPTDSGVPPTDGGVPPADAGFDDAGNPIDGGVVALPAPTITAISPAEALNVSSTEVTVTGTGFIAGLTLKIGSILTDRTTVAGASTITAVVPANIAAGSYDVVVQNPDGQSAILPKGFKVISNDTSGGGQVGEGCGCRSTGAPTDLLGLALLVGLFHLRRRS